MQFGSSEEPKANDVVAEALAALGLYCDDDLVLDEDEFWLWPESEEAFWLWCSVQTQWITGAAGPTGLNYACVESCMRMRGVPKKKQPELFGLLQVMEQAALDEWASKL